jgi:hypothetical protein
MYLGSRVRKRPSGPGMGGNTCIVQRVRRERIPSHQSAINVQLPVDLGGLMAPSSAEVVDGVLPLERTRSEAKRNEQACPYVCHVYCSCLPSACIHGVWEGVAGVQSRAEQSRAEQSRGSNGEIECGRMRGD